MFLEDVDEIVSKMTLEEKARIVVGVGMPGFFGNPQSRDIKLTGRFTIEK
ncbi:MAG: hypothetical protein QXH19_03665 [Candidatus Bathyarchaeia archaeon]